MLKTTLAIMILCGVSIGTASAMISYDIPIPYWYRYDHQPNENVLFPMDKKPMMGKGTENHHSNLDVDKFEIIEQTHTANILASIPSDVDITELTTSEVKDVKKQIESEKAMEIMRRLGYVK